MDKIEKIININNSRSHRNGILPFVRYGGNGDIEYVNSGNTNGNYGHFVCDFIDNEGNETRLKYLDIISRYNFIQECFRDAIFVKKWNDDIVEMCSDELSTKSRYDFAPVAKVTDATIDGSVVIPNYKDIEEINVWWVKHKIRPFGDNTEISGFTFCKDVEKYILGIIEVISEDKDKLITGSKVPNYVYYTNHAELIGWFDAHKEEYEKYSANTPSDKEWIINEWNERGGYNFYEFLTGNTPQWEPKLNGKVGYVSPTIDVETIINTEEDYETLYNVYEYSVSGNEIVKVVRPYSGATSEGMGSALTPTYVNLSTSNVYCESKLDSLIHHSAINVSDGIFGIYEEFFKRESDEYEAVGQMFECSIVTGVSSPNKEEYWASGEVYTYIFNEDGEKTGEKKLIDVISPYISGRTDEICAEPRYSDSYICYTACTDTITGLTNGTPTTIKNTNGDGVETGETIVYTWTASTAYTYQWWECKPVDFGDRKCADGEIITQDRTNEVYRNVTIVSCINSLEGKAKIGEKYYVLARYKNGRHSANTICDGGTIVPLKIPYIENQPMNITTYVSEKVDDSGNTISVETIVYDKIDSLVKDSETSSITITYTKGITSGETNSGIQYEETYRYYSGLRKKVFIDGNYEAELFYESIEDSLFEEEVYSDDYRLYRMAKMAKILGMEVGTTWTNEGAVGALLFTKDGYEGLQEEPKYNINLMYNRGNAAAWENHFKLSECNTLEDLENYGNNFFNL